MADEKVLLVDDRPENLLVLEGSLEDRDYVLVKAHSGPEALRKVLKQPFDLILLDVQMPGMDGFEVAELLQGKREIKDIPLIFITANSKDAKYIQRGYEVGAENYLFKPIDPDELKSKIAAVLKHQKYRKQMAMHDLRALDRQLKRDKAMSERRRGIQI